MKIESLSEEDQVAEAIRRSQYENEVPRTVSEEDQKVQEAVAASLAALQEAPAWCDFLETAPVTLIQLIGHYHHQHNDEASDLPQLMVGFELSDAAKVSLIADPAVAGNYVNRVIRQYGDDIDLVPENLRALFQTEAVRKSVTSMSFAVHSGMTVEKIRKVVVAFPYITGLTLSGANTGINDDCIATIVQHLPNLHDIDLNHNNHVTDRAARDLLSLNQLRYASLLRCNVNHGLIAQLRDKMGGPGTVRI